MTNKQYDILKFVSLLIAPIAAFLASLVSIWGIPYGQQIVATVTAIDTLLGAIVVVAKTAHDKAEKAKEEEAEQA